jgi:hypothetical protein
MIIRLGINVENIIFRNWCIMGNFSFYPLTNIFQRMLHHFVWAHIFPTFSTKIFARFCRFCAGLWFSPGTPVYSTNKTDRHNIIEILLKVTWITLTITSPTSIQTRIRYQRRRSIHLQYLLNSYTKIIK